MIPESSSESEAVNRAMQFTTGWFAEPIFGTGDYPEVMKTIMAGNSRLPAFTAGEIQSNQGKLSRNV
jgi:hypothetical protein